MREIKFRVLGTKGWAPTENKGWFYGSSNDVKNSLPFFFKMIGGNYYDKKTLSQYAGLKDKNGVEIYEGDIVSDGIEPKPYVVQFVTKGWCSTFELKHTTKSWSYSGKGLNLEVIGNIYENPELLKDK